MSIKRERDIVFFEIMLNVLKRFNEVESLKNGWSNCKRLGEDL